MSPHTSSPRPHEIGVATRGSGGVGLADMNTCSVETSIRPDDGGELSTARTRTGHGVHVGLAGHRCVPVDRFDVPRWYGEHPST